jgi:hypothetical protein
MVWRVERVSFSVDQGTFESTAMAEWRAAEAEWRGGEGGG